MTVGLGSMIGAGVFAVSALVGAGAPALATAEAPLAAAGQFAWLSPAVRVGATVASLGVLLSLIVGVSRTVLAMAVNRDLPRFLAAVHPRYHVPHRAEVAVGVIVAVVAAVADIRAAIGFSSFAVLVYYAVTNAAAWTLEPGERRWPRGLAAFGFLGCILLAMTPPLLSVVGGAILLTLGVLVYALRCSTG